MQKVVSLHNCLLTEAIASEKVGCSLTYQAACRTESFPVAACRSAMSTTSENRPNKAGVVRSIACSFHCRWVSTPRWVRTCWKVVSNCQRSTNQETIRCAAADRSVHNRACGAKWPCGSRISTQRIGTTGCPPFVQTHVSETISISRSPWLLWPYQPATFVLVQTVVG